MGDRVRRNVKIAGGVLAALFVVHQAAPAEKPKEPVTTVAVAEPTGAPTTAPVAEVPESVETTPVEATETPQDDPLLHAADGGDGDSWKDTAGREYRLGLVNAPETNECFGSAATAKRKELVADGFTADVYATDTYGRSVAVVTLADGRNLNVWLARHGYVNDRYLADFRHENPALATQLDAAFAAAQAEKAGLWSACAPKATPQAAAPQPFVAQQHDSGCHPSYETCVPIKGDGSGNGSANDLDCGDIRELVILKQIGDDPYRLDSNSDGKGCESYA